MNVTHRILPFTLLLAVLGCSRGDSNGGVNTKNPGDAESTSMTNATKVYDLTLNTLEGETVDLSRYEGKVSLVVNVASACGYTPQYAGLQALHAELESKGFQVLGFPCNDFGAQEPGSADQILDFCRSNYDVTFPMFEKVRIKGDASPIYQRLISATGETPGWNFCKYLVGKNGEVLGFYESGVTPNDPKLRAAIENAL